MEGRCPQRPNLHGYGRRGRRPSKKKNKEYGNWGQYQWRDAVLSVLIYTDMVVGDDDPPRKKQRIW